MMIKEIETNKVNLMELNYYIQTTFAALFWSLK